MDSNISKLQSSFVARASNRSKLQSSLVVCVPKPKQIVAGASHGNTQPTVDAIIQISLDNNLAQKLGVGARNCAPHPENRSLLWTRESVFFDTDHTEWLLGKQVRATDSLGERTLG